MHKNITYYTTTCILMLCIVSNAQASLDTEEISIAATVENSDKPILKTKKLNNEEETIEEKSQHENDAIPLDHQENQEDISAITDEQDEISAITPPEQTEIGNLNENQSHSQEIQSTFTENKTIKAEDTIPESYEEIPATLPQEQSISDEPSDSPQTMTTTLSQEQSISDDSVDSSENITAAAKNISEKQKKHHKSEGLKLLRQIPPIVEKLEQYIKDRINKRVLSSTKNEEKTKEIQEKQSIIQKLEEEKNNNRDLIERFKRALKSAKAELVEQNSQYDTLKVNYENYVKDGIQKSTQREVKLKEENTALTLKVKELENKNKQLTTIATEAKNREKETLKSLQELKKEDPNLDELLN